MTQQQRHLNWALDISDERDRYPFSRGSQNARILSVRMGLLCEGAEVQSNGCPGNHLISATLDLLVEASYGPVIA